MAAQDDDPKTDLKIQEDAVRVLTEVTGGDKDGNLAKALEFNKTKDPSLIMSMDAKEIGDLKINRNAKIPMVHARLLQLFKKFHDCQHCRGKSAKIKDWGETFKINDFNVCRVAACTWNTKDGLPHDAAWVGGKMGSDTTSDTERVMQMVEHNAKSAKDVQQTNY